MDALTIPVYNTQGTQVDSMTLDKAVVGDALNQAAAYQTVVNYMANQRGGLAATKTRGEVSGGGKKPWKQKGTGRARHGSTRSPLWRHGGVVFGPHPRDFGYDLPPKIKLEALRTALRHKAENNGMMVLESLSFATPSTKEAASLLGGLKLAGKKVLVLSSAIDLNTRRSLRNIEGLELTLAKDANAYAVMNSNAVVVTKDALAELTKRLQK